MLSDSTPDNLVGQVDVRMSHDQASITVAVAGEWDIATHPQIWEAVLSAVSRCPRHVVLDLSRVTFGDSSMVHAAVTLQQDTRRRNAELVIVPGPRAVQCLFELCGLTDVLPFYSRQLSLAGEARTSDPETGSWRRFP